MPARTRLRLLALAASAVVAALLLPGAAPSAPSVAVRDQVPAPVEVRISDTTRDAPSQRTPARVEAGATQDAPGPGQVTTAARRVGRPAAGGAAKPPSSTTATTATVEVLYSERADRSGEAQAASSSGSCPRATTCDVYQLQGGRWKTDETGLLTLKWRFNDAGRRNLRAPAGLLESALKAGMAEWHKWNSNINFVYSGTTTAAFGARGSNGSCDDGTNVIGWARMDPNIIAQVMTCLDSSGKRVVDADLALNVTQHWEDIQGKPESRHSFDIRSIVTHELGHILSLADLYSNDASYLTMMGNARYGETRKRTLGLGDIVGVQAAYKCGTGDTCSRKGIVND